jgi:FkbH-like protein
LVLTIAPATDADLDRAEELTVRTNQLNTTGRTYSREQLAALSHSPDHELLMAALEDRYGSYGKIGLALIERGADAWTLKLLLMSCRVMSRGVGSVFLNHIRGLAAAADAPLVCELIPTDRNRMMLITLRLGGFREAGERDGARLLQSPPGDVPPPPDHLTLRLGAPSRP